MLSPTGSADLPIASIRAFSSAPMSAAATPSLASVLTPYLRPASAVSVLTPSFSHLDSSAIDSSKLKPRRRIGEPKSTTFSIRSDTPIPVAWEARNTLSSVPAWSSVLIVQSPNSRVASRTLALTSVFVIRLKSSRLTARASSVSPVAPVRVLRSATTLPTVWRSSGTRFAARSYTSTRASSALPVAPGAGADLVDARLVVGGHLGRRHAHADERRADDERRRLGDRGEAAEQALAALDLGLELRLVERERRVQRADRDAGGHQFTRPGGRPKKPARTASDSAGERAIRTAGAGPAPRRLAVGDRAGRPQAADEHQEPAQRDARQLSHEVDPVLAHEVGFHERPGGDQVERVRRCVRRIVRFGGGLASAA